jgi:hypothetical protein
VSSKDFSGPDEWAVVVEEVMSAIEKQHAQGLIALPTVYPAGTSWLRQRMAGGCRKSL